ncbi:hypothetical protein ACQP1S_02425 [Micromonospora matsumotoense]|uniref:hypothetical protein n=1 Tax=Micromonospora matsumotoense TaxID=121616 RepID=UPI003D929757
MSPAEAGQPAGAAGGDPVRQAPAAVDRSATGGGSLRWRASGRPRRAVLLVGLVGAGAGGVAAGPVAAALLAGYGMLGARAVHRRRAAGQVGQERRRQLDRLGAFAADLRAGLPVPTLDRVDAPAGADGLTGTGRTATVPAPVTAGGSLDADCALATDHGVGIGTQVRLPTASRSGEGLPSPSPSPSPSPRRGSGGPNGDPAGTDRLERLARAAVRLADRTGAPLAELLERVEADARAFDRGMAAAAAQSAGANATALLLAALPLGGVALGYGIGVDPLAVLLHTPVGAACALVAMGLQAGGLLWAERLGATPGEGG